MRRTIKTSREFDPYETLASRVAELHVLIWRVETGANESASLVQGHSCGAAFDTPALGEAVCAAVGDWGGVPVNIEPGLCVSVLEDEELRKTVTVAMTLTDSFDAGQFHLRFWHDGLPSRSAVADIDSMGRLDGAERNNVVRLTQLMHTDLCELKNSKSVILGFSRELMDTYEHVGLLYRLGRAAGNRTPVPQFVSDVCDELRQYTQFGWIAALFDESSGRPSQVAGRFDPRGGLNRRDRLLGMFDELKSLLGESKSAILHPSKDETAARAGSEIAVESILLDGKVRGLIVAGDKTGFEADIRSVDTQLLKAASEFTGIFLENAKVYDDQRKLFMGTLQALTASIDAKDPYTCGHSERVALLAVMLGEELNLDPEFLEDIHVAGLVHDVGKIGVPEAVLHKPARLTEEEYGLIKQHPSIGYRILQDVPQLTHVLPGVLHHHERWDGGGYPLGLAGNEIPRIARLLSVADTFDAMSSTRSYREAISRDKVLAEIKRCGGSQLDPEFTPVFLKLDLSKYDEMVQRHVAQYRLAA